MIKSTMFLSAAAGLCLSGCGEKIKNALSEAKQTVKLQGTYEAKTCDNTPLADLKVASSRQILTFEGTASTVNVVYYTDAVCKDAAFEVLYKGSFEVGKDIAATPGSHELNMTTDSVTLTPRSQVLATLASGVNFCGINSWTSGTAADVTGKSCGVGTLNFPQKSAVYYTSYQEQGDNVSLTKMPIMEDTKQYLGTSANVAPRNTKTELLYIKK